MNPREIHRCVFIVVATLAACNGVVGQTQQDSTALEFLPAHRLFPRLPADGTAHQFGVAKDLHSRRWVGDIGAQRPLLQLSTGGIALQAGIGATVHTSFLRNPPLLQVVTVDFVIDVPVDIRLSPSFVLRMGYGHHSAHLADDGIEQLRLSSVNYAKDYLTLLSAYTLPEKRGYVYGGGRFDFHTLPATEKHWRLQCGCEVGPLTVLPFLGLYAALDVRFKEEAAWRSTQSYQVGARLSDRLEGAVRVAYTYRTGVEDRGQFFLDAATLSLLGIYVDF